MILSVGNTPLSVNGILLRKEPKLPPVDPYNPYNLDPGVVRLAFYDEPEQYDPNIDVYPQSEGTFVYVGLQEIDGFIMYVWDFIPSPGGYGLDERMKNLRNSFWLISWNVVGCTDRISYTFRGSKVVGILNPIDLYNLEHPYVNQITQEMFQNCLQLRYVAPGMRIYDAAALFRGCLYLPEIPVFDWSYVPTSLMTAFTGCSSVHSGMKRLYDNWSSVSSHTNCFENCGDHSAEANAELAQIPDDWK